MKFQLEIQYLAPGIGQIHSIGSRSIQVSHMPRVGDIWFAQQRGLVISSEVEWSQGGVMDAAIIVRVSN